MRTPIFIVNRNRVTSTRKLVDWLLEAGETNVIIVDNDSTYPPVLAYYDELYSLYTNGVVEVYTVGSNAGPYVVWEKGLFDPKLPYIVTDSDCVPSPDCPKDLIAQMLSVLNCQSKYDKIGPGIRIDNLPETPWKDHHVSYQQRYWQKRVGTCFEGAIDTTFAVYRNYWVDAEFGHSLRLDAPYLIEHTPWYVWPFSEEEKYYRSHAVEGWSTMLQNEATGVVIL